MSTDTTLKAADAEEAPPLEPFIAPGITPGTFVGIGTLDPKYNPGTTEYDARSNPQYEAANRRVFDLFNNTEAPMVPSSPGAPPYDPSTNANREFVNNIRGLLPEGKNTTKDAAWYALNVLQPQSKHDAKYIMGAIRPIISKMMADAEQAGENFSPADLTEENIIGIAKTAGVSPFLISKLIAEEGEINQRKATGSYTMGRLFPLVSGMDINTQWGKAVESDPENNLFPLSGQDRRDAFLAMTRAKQRHSPSTVRAIYDGVMMVAVEGGYAAGGFVEGGIGSLVAAGTLGNIMLENGRSVLSDAWLGRPKEEQDEANNILQTAHELAKRYGPELASAGNRPGLTDAQRDGAFAAAMERRFGEFADPNDIEAFRRLSELKKAGAFRPQMSAERLANFGEGVLNAVPSLISLFNASVDPNSFFFRAESNLKQAAAAATGNPTINVLGRTVPTLAAGVLLGKTAYEAWHTQTVTYTNMVAGDLDKEIDLWTQNWKQLNGKTESISGFFYRKSAETLEAMGASDRKGPLARGFEGFFRRGEQAAKSIMQEPRLQDAAALADPVLLVMGGIKLLGVGAKAAANASKLQTISAGLREVSSEAAALRASANKTSAVFDAAVSDLRVKLEAAFPSAKFTDDDIIGHAIGDRKSEIGKSASAQRIRTDIGKTIAKNKGLSKKVSDLTAQLDELPDDLAGIDKLRARPVGGAVVSATGSVTEGASNVSTALANFLDEEAHTLAGNNRRRILARGARFILSDGGFAGGSRTAGLFFGATYLASGEFLNAGIAGIVGIGANQLLRPDVLKSFGANLAQASRITKVLGGNVSDGRRFGDSTFLRGAADLEKEAAELQRKVIRLPGKPLTAAERVLIDKSNELVGDATKMRQMAASGLGNALANTGRVVWDDGLQAGLTGGVLAALNDSDAFGSGVGMGIGFSGVLKVANRAAQLTPAAASPVYARTVLGEVATILMDIKDPAQRSHILEFLGKAGDEEGSQIQRAGVIRDLFMSTSGRVKFLKSGEFEAASILTNSPEADAKVIMAEAVAIDPSGGEKALAYIKERTNTLNEARRASNRVTILTGDSNTNRSRIDQLKQSASDMDAQIKDQQAIVDAERIEFKDIKTVDANRIKLDRMLQARSELDANLLVASEQQVIIDGDLSEAKGKAKVEQPMRPYEQRNLPDGSAARSVGSGFYIVEGPQGKTVYVNIDTIDNIGAASEGWHALLADSAVESMMPDMVQMMWGNRAKNTQMAVLPEVTTAILDAYAADLSPEQRAKFNSQLNAGRRAYEDSNGADVSGLVEPTREAMTWILSAMDLDRRVGYRPGLTTRPDAMASATGFDAIRKTLFGDRTLADNTIKGLKNLIDPTYGVLGRMKTESVLNQLRQAGMRFTESGDGTLRGYFFNGNNEIIRSPVFDKFYDKVVTLTGGKGSLRARPLNLYDPLIPVEQRVEFIKRNGMDWALNKDGTDILPADAVAQIADGFNKAVEDTLNSVPEDQRGMEVYTNAEGFPVRTGIPSPAEMAAIAADQRIPQTYKDNLLTIMRTLGEGSSKGVQSAEYSNVFSMNVDALTEHRLRIGRDIAGKTETRNIIPLAFTIGEAPIYDRDGKKVRVLGPDGKKTDARQRVIRVHGFDINAFTDSKNHAFQQGLFITDKDTGKRTYLQDPKGNQYTATYINQLFGTDAEFMNKATLWMKTYYAHGPLDPYSPTPRQPNGSPREVNPVSAEVLDPVNPERGAAMRDALRVIFSLESGKKRLGWVEENRATNTATGMLTRGTNFPLTDFRLDQFGPLKPNGQSMFIDQIGTTSGQFVMSIKGWDSVKPTMVNGVSGMTIKTVFAAGENKFLPGEDIAVSEVRTHPTLPDVKIFIGAEINVVGRGGRNKSVAYTIGDGRIITLNTSDVKFAVQQVRQRVIAMEDAAYVDSILQEYRYNRDKPLEGARVAQVEEAGPITIDTKVKSGAEMIDLLNGVMASEEGGRNVPPSLRKFLSEENYNDKIANGESAWGILHGLKTKLKERQRQQKSPAEWSRLDGIIGHLDDATAGISKVSDRNKKAYDVPTKTLSMDSIRATFDLPTPGTKAFNHSDGRAGELFQLSKEFGPDEFTNNKDYLEAVISKLEEQSSASEMLESREAYEVEQARIQPLIDTARAAWTKLRNSSPELFEVKPPEAGAPAPTAGTQPIDTPASELTKDDVLSQVERLSGSKLSNLAKGELAVLVEDALSPEFLSDAGIEKLDGVLEDLQERAEIMIVNAARNLRDANGAQGGTPESLKEFRKDARDSLKAFEESKSIIINARKKLKVERSNSAPAPTTGTQPAAVPDAQPAGRDVQPRAGEAPEAPYMTPEEIAATREFRVGPDGKIKRITQDVKSEYDRWRNRYDAIVKKRKADEAQVANAAERERRIWVAEQNRRAQVEIDSEEKFAAQSRKRAQQMAERDTKEAARLQKEADKAQARADALRLDFERGIGAARAAADIKRVETNKLLNVVLSSAQPLIAPGLLLIDSNRLIVKPIRMAVATDTVRTPSATARTGILYLRNLAGYEGQTQAHQQAFFNYLFAEQIGKGKAIAAEAFSGPMAAQQGINLLDSRVWVAENSGAKLVRLYKNADKAAGRDLATYRVYGANGMIIKQTNDAQDAVEAIDNLERRFTNTLLGPVPPVTESNMLEYGNQVASAYYTKPANAPDKSNIPTLENKALQIRDFERYLPATGR